MAPSPLPIDGSLISFWRTHPLALDNFRSTAELPAEVDIAIIGAGYAGSSTAYNIIKTCQDRGVPVPKIAIIEARQACSGATGRNGGHLKPDPYYRAMGLAETHGIKLAAEIVNFEVAHIAAVKKVVEDEKIDCDFVLTRCCDVYFDPTYWAKIKAGIERLREFTDKDPANGLSTLKDLYVAEGADAERLSGVHKAIGLVTYTAGHLWPYKLVHALLTKAIDAGVNLQTHTPVTGVRTPDGPGGLISIDTARGTVKARRVVYATNGYTSSILPEYAGRIVPSRGICSHIAVPGTKSAELCPRPSTAPPAPADMQSPAQLNTSYMIRTRPDCTEYFIPRLDGGIIVGGARTAYMHELSSWYDNVDDGNLIEKASHYFDGYMQRTFRGWEKSGAYTSKVWTGVMGYSVDKSPHVGAIPGRQNQFIVAGFTGHGMPQVFLSTKAIAAMVVDNAPFESTGVPSLFKTSQERLDSKENKILEMWENATKAMQKL